MSKNLPARIFLRGEGRDNGNGLLAETRTSLRLVVHAGAVFICPGYVHGPTDGSYWKVIEPE